MNIDFKTFSHCRIGNSHVTHRKNCQDYYFEFQDENKIIGVVADGIGSINHSEFSAIYECTSILSFLKNKNNNYLNNNLERNLNFVLNNYKNKIKFIIDDDLFLNCYGNTLLILISTKTDTFIYGKGDGFYGYNSCIEKIYGNKYNLRDCTLELCKHVKNEEIKSAWISSDGLRYSKILQEYFEKPNEHISFNDKNDMNNIYTYVNNTTELQDDLAFFGIFKDK